MVKFLRKYNHFNKRKKFYSIEMLIKVSFLVLTLMNISMMIYIMLLRKY